MSDLNTVRQALTNVEATKGRQAAESALRKYAPAVTDLLNGQAEELVSDLEALLPGCSDDGKSRLAGPIEYESASEVLVLDQLMRALDQHAPKLGIFNFGGVLTQVLPGLFGVEISALNVDAFAAKLGQRVVFQKLGKNPTQTACPAKLANAMFNNGARLTNATIRRIAFTPILKDGVLQSGNGYHAGEHLYLDAPDVQLPAVCDRAAAEAALEYMCSYLDEFPFASGVSRAVAVAALLSAAMRASGLRAPIFAFLKPSHGAGASTLADLVHIALVGRVAPVINASKSAVEIDKEIDSAQGHGRPALVLDNIPRGSVFNSVALSQTAQQDFRAARILGESRSPVVECSQLCILTGVNYRVADDLVRRTVACVLDPQLERPELKVFKRPTLLADAQRERGKILQACYTIVAAFERSGTKVPVRVIAGYEQWCRMIGAALVWLGLPDPADSQDDIRAEDPMTEDLHSLVRLWFALFGTKPVTAHDIVNARATSLGVSVATDTPEQKNAREELAELLSRIAEDRRGNVSGSTLSYKLRSWRWHVADDWQICPYGKAHASRATWQLRKIEEGTSWMD